MNYCFDGQETHDEYCIAGGFQGDMLLHISKNTIPTKIKSFSYS